MIALAIAFAAVLSPRGDVLWRPAVIPRARPPAAASTPIGKGDVLMVPFFQPMEMGARPQLDEALTALDGSLGGALSELLCTGQFTGALGSSATVDLPRTAPFAKCTAVGLGRPPSFRTLGAMYVAWGELLARYTRAERCQLAVAVLPRIEGGLD